MADMKDVLKKCTVALCQSSMPTIVKGSMEKLTLGCYPVCAVPLARPHQRMQVKAS